MVYDKVYDKVSPKCCAAGTARIWWYPGSVQGWRLAEHFGDFIGFCPFCGTALPDRMADVTRALKEYMAHA